jgi:5-bromo-4-chloroindolyl phosphate hydrolysis protein
MIDFDDIFQQKRFDFKIVAIVIAAILVAGYIFELMMGKKSFINLIELENNVKIMEKKVSELKKENARLQKTYFELKELEGE